MTDVQQRKAAARFADEWRNKGKEKEDDQSFWNALLRDVFGVTKPESFIKYRQTVETDDSKREIDAIIPDTHVLIEQKSLNIPLNKKAAQSGGLMLTPYEQAKRYDDWLSRSKKSHWVITCNFGEFWIYDMEKPKAEPEIILLEDLKTEYFRLKFLVDIAATNVKKEKAVSLDAGGLIGEIHRKILEQYNEEEQNSSELLENLNMFCVRLVFCLYAEDAGILGNQTQFRDYLKKFKKSNVRLAVKELFRMLNTEEEKRSINDDKQLLAFDYINGGLFDDDRMDIPRLNEEIVSLIIQEVADKFHWNDISPPIFGSVFESTLNPETRRSGGMHYTSIEDIHKVIDPLFLDELKAELEEIKGKKQVNVKVKNLSAFQRKLSSLKFFDPACGSGNFLTETYLSLRRLENEVIALLYGEGQLTFDGDIDMIIKVSIEQFYGIEINDFAVSVAKTALWIAELQMMKETGLIVDDKDLNFLPLKSYANIVEGNALRIDWEEVVPKGELSYIMGNPPFRGARRMDAFQKSDMLHVFGEKFKNVGNLDYVSAWYKKASEYTQKSNIKCAFVSTNSITQGEQVGLLWKPLIEILGIYINFAHKTFKWSGEATVHCVIIGFSTKNNDNKIIFDNNGKIYVKNITPYLDDGDNAFIERRKKPICDVPEITEGNHPGGGMALYLTEKERLQFIKANPLSEKYIRPIMGAHEFINNKKRYCLWLVDSVESELSKMPLVMERIRLVRENRLANSDKSIKRLAENPTHFREMINPTSAIVVPITSSENRRYIPFGFIDDSFITSNKVNLIPNADLYHFGILSSSLHMAWVRAVCGRLEMRYNYSKEIVYNNFPWADASDKQKSEIDKLAQVILDIRKKHMENSTDCSLHELYSENFDLLYGKLKLAHKALDKAVMKLYGFTAGASEAEVVAGLMERYQKLTGGSDNG